MIDGYSPMFTRADDEDELCWGDGWNEKKISDLDFYLINADGKISFYKKIATTSEDCNVTHTVYEFKEGGVSNLSDLTFDLINSSSKIAMVANYPLDDQVDPIGQDFESLYSKTLQFTESELKNRQEKFVMVGIVDLPEKVSKYSNIIVPLRRIIAKIRVRVKDKDGNYLDADEFNSMLCRYSDKVNILPDAKLPDFDASNYGSGDNIFPATLVSVGPYANTDWTYPDDIPDIHPTEMVREEGHVYYSCPYDWIDYKKVRNVCSRNENSSHVNSVHSGDARYEITDCDDAAPIIADREMFLLIKAPFKMTVDPQPEEEGDSESSEDNNDEVTQDETITNYYIYKIPINYRISTINDQQCFSENDLIYKVFNLYRAERNHFYDITVLIDRPGHPLANMQ